MLQIRLHAKFLVLVLGSLSVFLGVLSYALVQRESNILAQKADEEQHVLAFTVLSDLKQSMLKGEPRSTLELMDSIRGTYGLVRLQVVRGDGSPAFGVTAGRLVMPQIDQVIKTGGEVSFQENGKVPLHTILYPLKNEGRCNKCHGRQKDILGVLLVSLSLEDAVKEIRESKRNLTFSLTALILMIGGMLYFAIRKVILSPLAILHEGAERIGRGELEHRISLSTNDEIQDLARSFNVMAGRIAASYSDLENKVQERTAQLFDAKEEVEDKARRLYEFSRDMASVSRLSTKVFNAEQSLEQILDRFMWAVDRGLGYKQALLCLVDRKRVWLDVKRDSGLGTLLGITSQSLSGYSPFTALVRTGKELYVHDSTRDPVFSRSQQSVASETRSLYVVPILNGTRNKRCWREKSCIRTDCPAYKREDELCWLVDNTYCGNELIESYHNKLAYCMTCDVFPVLGVLVVEARPGRPFKRRDISVLRILAAEMGAALENHRLYGDNRQVVKELLELHKVTALALAELSLDRTLEAFTDSALKFSGLDTCNFWLLTEDGRELTLKAGGCIGPEPEAGFCPERVPLDAGVLGRSFRQNAIITEYHDVFNDPTPLGKAMAARGLPSLLAV
ncbi:MAG TPA: HAMP domain-containing protein, partial [Nitrospirota bacterium]|nr:HAMP domain-containing protein [Nitrospirota bacterium]